MKKYILFLGDQYYPAGGWNDFSGSFDDLEAAKSYAEERREENSFLWWHVVDKDNGQRCASHEDCESKPAPSR